MSGIASKNAVVKIGDATNNAPAKLAINAQDIATAVAELDVSTTGNADMEYEPDQASHVFTSGGPWTLATHKQLKSIIGMKRALEVFPDGEGTGKLKQACTAFITAYSRNTALGSPATYSVTMRITGAVTDTEGS
ncbi:MAG: hypothetical protein OXU36_10575 [Candidatus Poribacteria bacterium]|nr:hypothetical protein [Candidatus Poribacteria bacterium]